MPKSTSTTSGLAEENSSAHSVLDFLYQDSRRIGSFLAQFEGDGHLQQLTRTKDGSKGKRDSSSHETKGNVGIVAGKLVGEMETSFEMSEGYAQVFDPYWSNARAFLDYLSERDLLVNDLLTARVGQFVMVKGHLSVLDLAMFKDAWKLPSIQRQVKAGVSTKKASNMTSAQKAAHQQEQESTQLFLDMLQIMPHSVHARMITSGGTPQLVWCTLSQEYLVAPASDITLTYGETMTGAWSIVGILSAHPEYITHDFNQAEEFEDPGLMQSIVGQVSKVLAPIVRLTLGRPAAAYAITPLLIFREAS